MHPFDMAELRNSVQQFVRLFGLLEQTVTPCGFSLSVSQVYALQELEKCPLSITELAEKLRLERSTVSRLADGLVKGGFVDRRPNEHNRREMRLTLTEKGARTTVQVRERSLAFYESAVGHLPSEDKRRIAEGFRLFAEALRRRGEDGGPA